MFRFQSLVCGKRRCLLRYFKFFFTKVQFKYNIIFPFMSQNTVNLKFRVAAVIHKLRINKNAQFQSKIVWRRSKLTLIADKNKTQTKTVNHVQGYSIFNQQLVLVFNMQFDQVKKTYLEKYTEILPAIIIGNSVKGAGSAKIDIAQALNNNAMQIHKKIQLNNCPDPDGYIELTLNYEQDPDNQNDQSMDMSIFNNSSIMNNSELEMKQNIPKLKGLNELNRSVGLFEQLLKQIASKGNPTSLKQNQQTKTLKENIKKLQIKLQNSQNERQSLKQQVESKTKQLDFKIKQILELNQTIKDLKKQRNQEIQMNCKVLRLELEQKNEIISNLEQQLKISESKIQLARSTKEQMLTQIDMNKDKFQISQFGKEFLSTNSEVKLEQLERQKAQLQIQLALASHKIGGLFNAAFQIGGAKLLDRLQSSIGLIQLN